MIAVHRTFWSDISWIVFSHWGNIGLPQQFTAMFLKPE